MACGAWLAAVIARQSELDKIALDLCCLQEDAFQSHAQKADDLFRASTVGLVSHEDFKKKRQMVEEADKIALEKKCALQ